MRLLVTRLPGERTEGEGQGGRMHTRPTCPRWLRTVRQCPAPCDAALMAAPSSSDWQSPGEAVTFSPGLQY